MFLDLDYDEVSTRLHFLAEEIRRSLGKQKTRILLRPASSIDDYIVCVLLASEFPKEFCLWGSRGLEIDIYTLANNAECYALINTAMEGASASTNVRFPWTSLHPAIKEIDAQSAVRTLLKHIGENPEREGLRDTPERVVKSYSELFAGYSIDVESLFTVFDEPCDEMILLKNIEFQSTCEHHMLPFVGTAHVAYIPNGKVVGISKLARLVDVYAKRLQIQERIGQQVTGALMKYLNPLGAACLIQSQHFCMKCRGVKKQNSEMLTSSLVGAFRDDSKARSELFSMIAL